MKRILACLLALAMALSCVGAFAEKGFFASIGGMLDDGINGATKAAQDTWDSHAPKVAEAWNGLTGSAADLWSAVSDAAGDFCKNSGLKPEEFVQNLQNWLTMAGEEARPILEKALDGILEKLGFAEQEIQNFMTGVRTYGKKKGIEEATLLKLSIAWVATEGIPSDIKNGDALARTLTDWLKKNGITSEATAQEALEGFKTALGDALKGMLP